MAARQALGDLPHISNYSNVSSTYVPGTTTAVAQTFDAHPGVVAMDWYDPTDFANKMRAITLSPGTGQVITDGATTTATKPKKAKEAMSQRRYVRVIIADPDENVPLEHSVLYDGKEHLTDLTDQELFFAIDDLNIRLKNHNERRITFKDKKVKERVEFLEPARIRDLRMVVVTVAQF